MILLYMMNTSSFYRERKFEIINFKFVSLKMHILCNLQAIFFPSHAQLFLFWVTERNEANTKMRKLSGTGDPRNLEQSEMLPTQSKNKRKLKSLWRRMHRLQEHGVQRFHATQARDTLLLWPNRAQCQNTSLSPHTTRFTARWKSMSHRCV